MQHYDTNYQRYLNKSINNFDRSSDPFSRKNSTYVYVPPHQRHPLNAKLAADEQRSKSFDADLSKKQNTFGLQGSQDSYANINKQSGQKEHGFVSPKFKLGSEERKPHHNTDFNLGEQRLQVQDSHMSSVDSETPERIIQDLSQKLQLKHEQLEECQRQIRQMILQHEQRLMTVKAEKNQQLEKQIEEYVKELRTVRKELDETKQKYDKLRQKMKSTTNTPGRKRELYLNDHNQNILAQLDKRKPSDLSWTSPLNDSHINCLSLIERQSDNSMIEKTLKCLADELNIDTKPNGFSFMNNDVLEGVKTLKNLNKEQQKFIKCLKDLVMQCAPKSFFQENEPSLRDMWKFIKHVLGSYVEGKRQIKGTQEIVETLSQYLQCNPAEILSKAAGMMVENEVLRRIKDRVKELLGIQHVSNVREVERQLEAFFQK